MITIKHIEKKNHTAHLHEFREVRMKQQKNMQLTSKNSENKKTSHIKQKQTNTHISIHDISLNGKHRGLIVKV